MSFDLANSKTVKLMPLEVPEEKNAATIRSAVCALLKPDCNIFEKGEIINALMLFLGYSEKEVSSALGLSEESIKRKLSLLCFSESERKKLLTAQTCEMSAFLLSRLPPVTRRFAVMHCTKNRLSISQTKAYIKALTEKTSPFSLKTVKTNTSRTSLRFIGNIGFVINSIEKAVSTAKGSGFDVEYEKKDEGDFFGLTLYMSKKPNRRKH